MIKIDYSRDALLTEFGIKTLVDRYLLPHEASPQDAFARAATAFSDTEEMAQRIYDYASRLWFMYSTPVLTNAPVRKMEHGFKSKRFKESFFGYKFEKIKGMPISCFLNYVEDSREGILGHYTENGWLASSGGGIGGYWGHVRSNDIRTANGSASSGAIPFMHVVDSEMLAFSQGTTRRGSYAAYLDLTHPEIMEFLDMRKPSGGDIHRKCLNLHHGINVPDYFMSILEACTQDPDFDDSWELIDPHTKQVVHTVSARELWQKIMEMRVSTGEPYLHFIDRSNEALPEYQKALGLQVHQSNLCSEITLPTNDERTAVCCLSSVNLEKFDEWKDDPQFIKDIVRFLDNVLEFFILNAPDALYKARFSAQRERSIGIGAMGFHAYLQSKMIPFESPMAVGMNVRMFKHIKEQANAATRELAQQRGEAPDATGYGVRNCHLLSVAPNASSSIICGGTSPSIEPYRANAFTQKTMSGSALWKNKYLDAVIKDYVMREFSQGFDPKPLYDAIWKSIITHKGSVQHLDFLTDYQKDVFKTAMEIDQRWIIDMAGDRQKFICQSQSVNLFLPSDIDIPTLHHIHFRAWKKGLKSLYYCRSEAVKRADVVSDKVERVKLNDYDTCLSCEG